MYSYRPILGGDGSVLVMGRIVLWTDNQTPALLGTSIDDLNDIDQVLFVVDVEVQLVIVSRPKIAHHMFVPPEEHDRAHIVEFVHLVEVLDDGIVASVDDSEVSDFVGDLIEHFVLGPGVLVLWVAKSYHHHSFVFGHAGLVDVPG